MGFQVSGAAYDRFMGRYSRTLAPQLADFAGIAPGQRVLDVGSGPGALTTELVKRLGAAGVAAVEPSAPFVEALHERLPDVHVQQAAAEQLPFADDSFDAALAQLVVHFMRDPVAGLRELARVTRPGGVVAASVWDHAGERSPIATLWEAARELDPEVHDESDLAGAREGALEALFRDAGLQEIAVAEHEAAFTPASFEEWWEPFTLGVGPAGAYVTGLDEPTRSRLRERCRALWPDAAPAVAWAARGRVSR
jgi:ubiquinone/menaquinone biosynthesis C-methylase UbiE